VPWSLIAGLYCYTCIFCYMLTIFTYDLVASLYSSCIRTVDFVTPLVVIKVNIIIIRSKSNKSNVKLSSDVELDASSFLSPLKPTISPLLRAISRRVVYIYIFIYIYRYTCIYIYIYIYRKRGKFQYFCPFYIMICVYIYVYLHTYMRIPI
jgi:hypothetical protein